MHAATGTLLRVCCHGYAPACTLLTRGAMPGAVSSSKCGDYPRAACVHRKRKGSVSKT